MKKIIKEVEKKIKKEEEPILPKGYTYKQLEQMETSELIKVAKEFNILSNNQSMIREILRLQHFK